MRNVFLTVILLLHGAPSQLNAQNCILNFFSLGHKDGLSDNFVSSIARDADGYMWFGTNNGLNRYDGYDFTGFFAGDDTNALPENKISKLYLTDKGDLWIGLDTRGICRFDGITQSFRRYRLTTDPDNVSAGTVKGIAEDRDHVLYVATSGGLFFKEPGSDTFDSIPCLESHPADSVGDYNGLLSRALTAICPDDSDGIWIAYENWQLTHYSRRNNSFTHYSLREYYRENRQTLITSMLSYQGKLWLGALGPGFIVFDPKNNDNKTLLAGEYFVNIGEIIPSSQKDILWLATGSGLVEYNTVSGAFCRFTYIRNDNRSMSTTACISLYEDNNGLIWVGTVTGGINYAFRDKPFQHWYVGLDTFYALGEENVTSMMFDSQGNLWVGYVSGLIEYNRNEDQRKYTIPIHSLFGDWGPGRIWDLFEDSGGDIYCASWQGGLQKFDRSTFSFRPVPGSARQYFSLFDGVDIRDIEEGPDGKLWLAMHGKGVGVYDKKRQSLEKYVFSERDSATLSNDWVFDMTVGGDGSVWIGSAWGLTRIFPDDRGIRRYFSTDDTLSLTANLTLLVTGDRQGNIWVGTDQGLNLYDPEIDGFHRFDAAGGLPVEQIRSLEQAGSGAYWSGTTNGLLTFDLLTRSDGAPVLSDVHMFDKDDGLQSEIYNQNCSFNSLGTIFFGGNNGIDFFDPGSIRPVKIEPQLRIKSIRIFGETIQPGTPDGPPVKGDGTILLDHRQNMLSFDFVALNYFDHEGNKYSYRLSPLHSNWIGIGQNRNISFSGLDPGHYNLSLKVETEDRLRNEFDNAVSFFIKPPFWQTWLFRMALILTVTGLILVSIWLYTGNLRKKKVQLERTVQIRTKEVTRKNRELEEQSVRLTESNALLEQRQERIKQQTEELKVQSEQLARSNEEMNVLNNMKDKFFSIIAHDLKNPFNTIIGFTDLLINGYDNYTDEKRMQMLGYVNEAVGSAYSLLSNLLHWSRSQTDRLHVRPMELSVAALTKSVYGLMNPMLQRKEITLTSRIDEELVVWADKELLETVLRNLVNNAIKFTAPGGNITFSASQDKDGKVLFSVTDNGTGMEKKVLDNLFRIDVSIRKKGTEGEEGTGLGMLICKEFIEKMGGTIRVESKLQKGTTVSFMLPAREVAHG